MTWCPLKAKPVTRAFREVQRCPNEPLKAAKRAAPQSERGTKKTRLRAKFLAQNCYAPTNKRQQKNAVVFCRLVLTLLARSFFWLGSMRGRGERLTLHARRANSSRNSVLKTATHRQKNIRQQKLSDIFMSACPNACGAVRFWAWFYAVTSISAIEKRFRNVAEGNISRGGQMAAVFHVCAKRRHFTAGNSVSGMPSPRLRGLF